PLAAVSPRDVTAYSVTADGLLAQTPAGQASLAESGAFAGYTGDPAAPSSVLLRHHGLHIELVIDRTGAIGATDRAGIQDVLAEAAVTTIVDFEDSAAAVDGGDKGPASPTWLRPHT